ncbi:hypothetical protein PUN28_017249 [Cardiocondyla obscurior]|uniref:Uncharacterized protein n=1 Tax=Cardiocondyla obscurior TaxID=286306 RepID=A0AAW2EKY0_9HYME
MKTQRSLIYFHACFEQRAYFVIRGRIHIKLAVAFPKPYINFLSRRTIIVGLSSRIIDLPRSLPPSFPATLPRGLSILSLPKKLEAQPRVPRQARRDPPLFCNDHGEVSAI